MSSHSQNNDDKIHKENDGIPMGDDGLSDYDDELSECSHNSDVLLSDKLVLPNVEGIPARMTFYGQVDNEGILQHIHDINLQLPDTFELPTTESMASAKMPESEDELRQYFHESDIQIFDTFVLPNIQIITEFVQERFGLKVTQEEVLDLVEQLKNPPGPIEVGFEHVVDG
jgi:hypothetical protein